MSNNVSQRDPKEKPVAFSAMKRNNKTPSLLRKNQFKRDLDRVVARAQPSQGTNSLGESTKLSQKYQVLKKSNQFSANQAPLVYLGSQNQKDNPLESAALNKPASFATS